MEIQINHKSKFISNDDMFDNKEQENTENTSLHFDDLLERMLSEINKDGNNQNKSKTKDIESKSEEINDDDNDDDNDELCLMLQDIISNSENNIDHKTDTSNKIQPKIKITTDSVNEIKQETNESNDNHKLNFMEIGSIAITNFQQSAYIMIKSINDNIKLNNVSGKVLIQYYRNRNDLQKYLQGNVRRKLVHFLTDMLWKDYMNNKQNKLFVINEYTRKDLLKYFISLYMHRIQNVIIKHELDSNKCATLKCKGICKILTSECGLTIGVATNVADTIYNKIKNINNNTKNIDDNLDNLDNFDNFDIEAFYECNIQSTRL